MTAELTAWVPAAVHKCLFEPPGGKERVIRQAVLKLPPFSPVAQKLMVLIDRPDVSLKLVADTIQIDPAMTANVLRLANSALFNCRSQVANILQALAMLGMARVHDLVVTTAMAIYTGRGLGTEGTNALRRCWRHNLATALIAAELAPACGWNQHSAYLGGLLHEIGRLALLKVSPDLYSGLLRGNPDDSDLWQKEESLFGIGHRELGDLLALRWNFPASLRQAIGTSDPDAAGSCCDLVDVASRAADVLGFLSAGTAATEDVDSILGMLPSAARALIAPKATSFWQEIAVRINATEGSFDF